MSSSMLIGYVCALLFLIVVEIINSQECGQSSYETYPDSSVVITEEGFARQGQWPWVVAITSGNSSDTAYLPDCSGFLIDRRHIISAAHCYDKKDAEMYKAHIGNVNQSEGDEYQISRIVVPPNYTAGKFYDDIAILTLEHEVNSSNIKPICLPDKDVSKMNVTDRRTAVTGWGFATDDIGIYLKFQTGRIISNEQCEEILQEGSREPFFRSRFPYGVNRDFICIVLEEEEYDVSQMAALLKDVNSFPFFPDFIGCNVWCSFFFKDFQYIIAFKTFL